MKIDEKMERKIDELMSDRQKFNDLVYTPVEEVLDLYIKRETDEKLIKKVANILPEGTPEIMRGKKNIVIFRHIATLNHEIRRFIIAADAFEDFQPVILEYLDDKFNNRNDWKYSLGRLSFFKGYNKKREQMFECHNIIDFNDSNNKPLSSIKTRWGELLVDFHHRLFTESQHKLRDKAYDLSGWLKIKGNGNGPRDYYKLFLSLFICNGILFENFLIKGKEGLFTKEVILPALLSLQQECGVKPMIVALEPTDIEDDRFWLSHPMETMELLRLPVNNSGKTRVII